MSEPRQRMRRVNEAVKEVLSSAIATEMKDPRLGFVTVTGADVSSDLRHAKVFVSVLGRKPEKEKTLKILVAAHGYLQSRLADELHMKRTPELEFIYDDSVDEGMKIQMMLRKQERELGIDLSQAPDEEPNEDDLRDGEMPPGDKPTGEGEDLGQEGAGDAREGARPAEDGE